MQDFIHGFSETRVEYIEFCDPETLETVQQISSRVIAAMAVHVGTTRLIDNALIDL